MILFQRVGNHIGTKTQRAIMKLTAHRMLGWQTSCLRGFLVILGFVLVLAIVSAQEKPSGEADAKPAAKLATPAKTPPDKAVANSKMPDISGKWRFTKEGSKTEVEMRRVEDGSADFAFGGDVEAVRVKWSDDAQRFEGTLVTTSPKIVSKITMQLLSDQKTLRVVTSLNEQAKQHILKSRPNLSDTQLVELMTQEWTRVEKPVGKADLSADAITVSTTPTAAKPVADSKMPDISGTWSVSVAVPVNRFVEAGEMEIRRIQNGDTDFLIDQPWVTNPTRIPVKWSPARQQFEGTWWEDDGPQSKITMQVPADGKPMRVVISTKKQDGETTASQREELSNQEWTRTSLSLSTKFPAKLSGLPATTASSENDDADGTNGIRAAGVPNESPANEPQATSRRPDAVMPDITGTWGPYARNEVLIRREKSDSADFEMTTRLLPQFKKSDPYAEYTPFRRIKWFPEAQHFQTLDPRHQGIATLTMKPNADGKSMHVTVTINGKPVDERFGKDAGEMEWTRTELDDSQGANTSSELDSELEVGQRRRTNAPNIGGRWREAETETDRFVIRSRRTGTGFEIASLDDDQPFEGIVEWSREKGRFEGTATVPRNFRGPIPLVLKPEDGGKRMRVRLSLSDEQRKEMLKHWQEFSEKHRVQEIDSWKEQEEALIASCHQVWVRSSVGLSLPAEPAAEAPRLTASALPDTPAAKRLVEQLGTQESAAAEEAGTIRQLQASGQAEQNQQPIAEHQRKLKNLLSTAFDLKLQWEELQVKELQSRLSRLERQIGQRKELREKIINRRAGELVEGDTLRWTRDTQPVALGAKQTSLDADVVPFGKNTGEMLPRMVSASDPLLTCVGIRWLNDGTKSNRGSGTIIESEPGRAVILTCAHLVRDMPADAVIVVDLFTGLPNPQTVVGKLLGTDMQADLALLTIAIPQRLPVTKIRTQDSLLKINDKLFSVGCDGEGKPSREDHVVTMLNKYTGPDNIECIGLPQQGRSGAGLFLGSELIGVCTAADPQGQRGVYVGLKPIAQLLSTERMGYLTSQTSPPKKMQLIPEKDASRGLELPLTGNEATSVLKADQIVIDLYGGSQVLPGLGKNPGYTKLLQSLNVLKGVTTNILVAGQGDVIVMAIVRDPSQRCQREARQTQKESELRIAINSALKAAGIEATRWDENSDAISEDNAEAAAPRSATE